MEPTQPTIRDLSVISNKKERRIPRPTDNNQNYRRIKKLITPRLRFGETVNARAYSIQDSPTKHSNEITTECNGTPTEDWRRRQTIATIKRHNAKHDQQREYPDWINDYADQYMTTKRPLPASDQERTYVFDKHYRCDPWDRPDQSSLTYKEQPIATVTDQNTNASDEQSPSPLPREHTNGSITKPIFLDDLPVSLNCIKEYISEKGGNTIPLKKRRRMLYLPLEFGEITMEQRSSMQCRVRITMQSK